jgi:hypothetical protein
MSPLAVGLLLVTRSRGQHEISHATPTLHEVRIESQDDPLDIDPSTADPYVNWLVIDLASYRTIDRSSPDNGPKTIEHIAIRHEHLQAPLQSRPLPTCWPHDD